MILTTYSYQDMMRKTYYPLTYYRHVIIVLPYGITGSQVLQGIWQIKSTPINVHQILMKVMHYLNTYGTTMLLLHGKNPCKNPEDLVLRLGTKIVHV